jgi:cyclase
MQRITDNVYVETGFRGCNTSFVVTGEGVVVIDTPMVPADAKKWAEEAGRHAPVRYVINTEPHIDHFAGSCYFGGMVIGHEGTRKAIAAAPVEDLKRMLQMMAPDGTALESGFRYRPPEITLSERLTIYLGQHTFQLIHMPGHTPYQVSVYVPEERVVFTSDNVNLGTPVFIDAVPDDWLESLRRYQELDVDKVVPGHGDICGKDCFAEMSGLIGAWVDGVAAAIARGMSLEEAQEKLPLEEPFCRALKEGPMPGLLSTNIGGLYRHLKEK